MAMVLIEEQKETLGKDVTDIAIEKVKKDIKKRTKEKGGEEDGKKESRRKTTKSV